tara:strand:- start:135 stop:344 length:210 start_codon:yes stop_codon:yes gene_type:complete
MNESPNTQGCDGMAVRPIIPMKETNAFLINLLTQLVMFGYSNDEIMAHVTDNIRPLTHARIDAFRKEAS